MENTDNDLDFELLNNSLLLCSIIKNKTPDYKIEKIKKYLDRGADINTTDANNKNNTPLHVAVMKREPEVVRFLLEQGAVANNKNSDDQTALDIARLSSKSSDKTETIVNILEAFTHSKLQRSSQQKLGSSLTNKSYLTSSKVGGDPKYLQPVAFDTENPTQSSEVKIRKAVQNKSNQQQLNKQLKTAEGKEIFCYQKRPFLGRFSGLFYETKLLSLILFRALYVRDIKTFLLASNVDCMGAFDDIVFRFCSNEDNKPRIIFMQPRHRANPAKDKFTVDEIMKLNGDFSLHKYLESYIKISQMFTPENNDVMFRGEFENMDCEFIIYTSADEKFSKKKSVEKSEVQFLIATSKDESDLHHHNQTKVDHVFQFDYEDQDLEFLVQTVARSRAVLLAKRLSKFIFKENYSNMMMDDLIKTYHVFLAQHILEVEINKDGESLSNFRNAKFRESFFSSNDSLLLEFKDTICKEVLVIKKIISPENLDQVESILMSLSFKVPVSFGNLNFSFGGTESKKGKKLEYLCSKFKQIFANANVSISANIIMKVDDNMVGPNEILQSTDLESYRLGGLVGNLLVFDNVTRTLKFNFDEDTLSEDNLILLEKLKNDVFKGIDPSKCRFDINVKRFPRISLIHDEHDKKLIQDFLSKLFFYTNQATEDKVEEILKEEIDKYYVGRNDALFRVKGDTIFLKVHDLVQKWWNQSFSAPYLTESCKYFSEAERYIFE